MINLAVINLKNVLKSIIKIIIVTIIVTMIFKFIQISNFKKQLETLVSKISINHTEFLESNICISNYLNNKEVEEDGNFKKILITELALFYNEEELIEKENQEQHFEEDIIVFDDIPVEQVKQQKTTDVSGQQETQVLEQNNKTDRFTNNYGSVKIKNESSYNLTSEMVTPNIDFKNKKDIVIFHTHTCESYTPTPQNNYDGGGKYRTTDLNFNIARVGTELTNTLISKGYNVIHDKTIHDSPAFTGSYNRSLDTAKNVLSKTKAELVLDIHRDALGNNNQYAPCVKIGDEIVAQIMFVIGTNGGGLEHDNWNNNLKLAIKIQEKANEMYPGLFKPIMLRDSRYNQHIARGASIIEIGATGNTLEQCIGSMKYLAEVISQVMVNE